MFKVSISNSTENKSWEAKFETLQEANEWLAKQIGKPNRLPERVIKNEAGEEVTLPAEFTSEIIDLSLDVEYVKDEARAKRRKEYPSLEEMVEALLDDKEGKPQKQAIAISLSKAGKSKPMMKKSGRGR